MAAARLDGERRVANEHDDPASRRVRYAYLAAMVLATATAVAVVARRPRLPAAIVPLMPRGLDCLDWTAAPGAFVRFVDLRRGVLQAGS